MRETGDCPPGFRPGDSLPHRRGVQYKDLLLVPSKASNRSIGSKKISWFEEIRIYVIVQSSGKPHSQEEAAGSILREKLKVTTERARIIRNVISEAEKRIANLVLRTRRRRVISSEGEE